MLNTVILEFCGILTSDRFIYLWLVLYDVFQQFQPLEWLNLWYMAQEREQDYQEHLLERKRRLHTKLISAQDEKFRESRLRAEKLEQKVKYLSTSSDLHLNNN